MWREDITETSSAELRTRTLHCLTYGSRRERAYGLHGSVVSVRMKVGGNSLDGVPWKEIWISWRILGMESDQRIIGGLP